MKFILNEKLELPKNPTTGTWDAKFKNASTDGKNLAAFWNEYFNAFEGTAEDKNKLTEFKSAIEEENSKLGFDNKFLNLLVKYFDNLTPELYELFHEAVVTGDLDLNNSVKDISKCFLLDFPAFYKLDNKQQALYLDLYSYAANRVLLDIKSIDNLATMKELFIKDNQLLDYGAAYSNVVDRYGRAKKQEKDNVGLNTIQEKLKNSSDNAKNLLLYFYTSSNKETNLKIYNYFKNNKNAAVVNELNKLNNISVENLIKLKTYWDNYFSLNKLQNESEVLDYLANLGFGIKKQAE